MATGGGFGGFGGGGGGGFGAAHWQTRKGCSGGSVALCCPHHPQATLVDDYSAGDMICSACGLVVGERLINQEPEWRNCAGEAGSAMDHSRVGRREDPLTKGKELTTYIASKKIAYPPLKKKDTQFYAKWHRSGSASKKGLVSAFTDIGAMADRIHLPKNIVDDAKGLFARLHAEKMLKGYANGAIATACLHIACRQHSVTRTFKEMCAISNHSKKDIGRCFLLIRKTMGSDIASADSAEVMSRFCAQLSLSAEVRRVAAHITRQAQELNVTGGRVYLSVVASAIYMAAMAAGSRRTQREVGRAVGVADSTIRQTYRLMHPHSERLLPTDFAAAHAPPQTTTAGLAPPLG